MQKRDAFQPLRLNSRVFGVRNVNINPCSRANSRRIVVACAFGRDSPHGRGSLTSRHWVAFRVDMVCGSMPALRDFEK